MALLQTANAFFAVVPKAKTAKIVRTIIDIVAKVPDSGPLQVSKLTGTAERHERAYMGWDFGGGTHTVLGRSADPT